MANNVARLLCGGKDIRALEVRSVPLAWVVSDRTMVVAEMRPGGILAIVTWSCDTGRCYHVENRGRMRSGVSAAADCPPLQVELKTTRTRQTLHVKRPSETSEWNVRVFV